MDDGPFAYEYIYQIVSGIIMMIATDDDIFLIASLMVVFLMNIIILVNTKAIYARTSAPSPMANAKSEPFEREKDE